MSLAHRIWLWLLDLLGLIKQPSPLVALEYDMSNARLNWLLPTPTSRQQPLDHVRIEGRISLDLPWAELNVVPVPTATLLMQDIDPGEWMFRGIVVDVGGRESTPLSASLSVPFDDPSPLSELTATLE